MEADKQKINGITDTNDSSESSLSTRRWPKINKILMVFGFILVWSITVSGGYYYGLRSTKAPTPITDTAQNNLQTGASAGNTSVKQISRENLCVAEHENVYVNDNFKFSYPLDWDMDVYGIFEHKSGLDSDTLRYSNQNNVLEVRVNSTMYVGYTNLEWFEMLASLEAPYESGRDVFEKLLLGETSDGARYVIFKQGASDSFEGEPLPGGLMGGYIYNDGLLYELRLTYFDSDSDATELLKGMLDSFEFTQS